MSNEKPNSKKLVERMGERFGVDPDKLLTTLKNTAFRQRDAQITNEQMMALLVVAEQYGLNPFTKEIYAFPDKNNGIVPVVGIDGWSRIINSNPNFDGIEFEQVGGSEPIDNHSKPCPEAITCVIYRKDREHPTKITEYLDEVYRPPFIKNKGQQNEYAIDSAWQTHTKRMLRWKAMIQCARVAFGFVGIYDEDEAERVIEGQFREIETQKALEDNPGNVSSVNNILDKAKNGDQEKEPVKAKSEEKTEGEEQAEGKCGDMFRGDDEHPDPTITKDKLLSKLKNAKTVDELDEIELLNSDNLKGGEKAFITKKVKEVRQTIAA